MTKSKTTVNGYKNKHGQITIGLTDPVRKGNHSNQRTYVVHCPTCEDNYGVNGCDLHERKCPTHQGGKQGNYLTEFERRMRP